MCKESFLRPDDVPADSTSVREAPEKRRSQEGKGSTGVTVKRVAPSFIVVNLKRRAKSVTQSAIAVCCEPINDLTTIQS